MKKGFKKIITLLLVLSLFMTMTPPASALSMPGRLPAAPIVPSIAPSDNGQIVAASFDPEWLPQAEAYADDAEIGILENGFLGPLDVADPFAVVIRNATDLANIKNDLAGSYVLANDITLSGEWTPIANFTGQFDGRGYSIHNMTITETDITRIGLFGSVNNATLKNVALKNIRIDIKNTTSITTAVFIGGLVGYVAGRSTVNNCFVTGSITHDLLVSNSYIVSTGGVIGYADSSTTGSLTIANTYSQAVITGTKSGTPNFYIGGILGVSSTSYYRTSITNCYNTGNISYKAYTVYAGGIAGICGISDVAECHNTGAISPIESNPTSVSNNSSVYAGGLFGHVISMGDGNFRDSYNSGDVTAMASNTAYAGGLAASLANDCERCYNSGDVLASVRNTGGGSTTAYAGGLAGWASRSRPMSISNSYNAGDVSGYSYSGSGTTNAYVGGIAGYGFASSYTVDIEYCYSTGAMEAYSGTASSTNRKAYAGGICGYAASNAAISHCITACSSITSSHESYKICGSSGETNTADLSQNATVNSITGTPLNDPAATLTLISAAQAKQAATYTNIGWDFSDIWEIEASKNNGYPILKGLMASGGEPNGNGNDDTEPALTEKSIVFPVGSNEYSVDVTWGADLFSQPSNIFSDRLALLSAALCGATYNIDAPLLGSQLYVNGHHIEEAFRTLDFPDKNIRLYSYSGHPKNQDGKNGNPSIDGADDDDLAFAIANRDIIIDGIDYSLIVIALRGTQGLGDQLVDINIGNHSEFFDYEVVNGFKRFHNDVITGWNDYVTRYSLKANKKILIVGHSLGGAAGQLISASFQRSLVADSSDIYTYTIASLNPITNKTGTGKIGSYNNIFNIVNPDNDNYIDWPDKDYSKFGTILAIPAKDSWNRAGEINDFVNEYKKIMGGDDTKARENKGKHEKEVYIAWIKSTPTYGTKLTKGIYTPDPPRYIRIACPVDVFVYNSVGELVGSVIDNVVDEDVLRDILLYVDGDVKHIYLPVTEEFRIDIVANDTGMMNMDVGETTVYGDSISNNKSFLNIQLTTGKQMTLDTSEDISVAETKLFVIDNQDIKTAEIQTDGTEIPFAKGDVSGDGIINMQDVLLIYQCFRGKTVLAPERILLADVNSDSVVNMLDVLSVYQYFRGKISSFDFQ